MRCLVPFLELCVFDRVRVLASSAPARGGVTVLGVVVANLVGLRPEVAKHNSGTANPAGSEHLGRIGWAGLVCKGFAYLVQSRF